MEKYVFYKNEETEIDLVALFFYVLRRWRSILVALLIGAFALGTFKFIKEYPNLSEKVDYSIYESELAYYENEKDNYEKTLVNLEERLEYTREYAQNSIKMMINPYEEYCWNATYYLTLEDTWDEVTLDEYQRRGAAILSAYTSLFKSNAIEEYFGVVYPNEDMKYLKELCAVSTNTSISTITFSVIADTQDRLDNLSACMEELLHDTNAEWKMATEAHTLTQLSSAKGVQIDTGLASTQENVNNKVLTLEQDIYNKQKALDELKEPAKATNITVHGVVKSTLKYMVLGAVLGMVLLAGVYFVIYLFSGCIHMQEDLVVKYGVEVLAMKRGKEQKNVIDKLLRRMDGMAIMELSDDVFLEVIVAKLKNLVGYGKRIALVGSVSTEQLDKLVASLAEKTDGIEFVLAGNLAESGTAITLVNKADVVLLVEEREKSKLCMVEAQLRYIAECEKFVVGAVLI